MIKNFIDTMHSYLIYILVLSIFFIEKIKILSFSIYEFFFIILFIFSIKKISKFNFRILLKTENVSLILFILLILYKYFFYREFMFPVFVMFFLFTTYFLILFLVSSDGEKKKTYNILKKGFEIIFIISTLKIFIFYILKNAGFLFEDFWYIREDIFPYLNYVTIHFKGFYTSYNYQAYIMIPGYFYLLEKIFIRNNRIYLICFLLISFFIFFIIKAKVLFLVTILSFFYILISYNKFNKLFFYLFLFGITFTYVVLTHLIPSNIELVGDEYKHYFTDNPIFSFDNFLVYGSLFYKIKVTIIQNINLLDFIPPNKDFYLEQNLEPHSVYFLLIYNYGILTLICFLLFLYNIFLKFNNLFFKNKKRFLLIDLLIVILFLIEGFNQDINSYRFFWISLSMLVGTIYINSEINFEKNHKLKFIN